MFAKHMEANNHFMKKKTEATLQDQNATIKNLEAQIGQMAIALTSRPPSNLPSNTKINPREHVKAITTRSGVQLPEIHVKRPGTIQDTTTPVVDEEYVEKDEQTPKTTPKEISATSVGKTQIW